MRNVFMLIAVSVCAASANATFSIHFTNPSPPDALHPLRTGYDPAGLTDPAYTFQPTAGNHGDYDYYDGEAIQPGPYAVMTFPSAWHTPTVYPGDPVYMWFHIDEGAAGYGIVVQGIHCDLKATSGAEPYFNGWSSHGADRARIQDICYYVMDSRSGSSYFYRWDGSQEAPGYWDFRNDNDIEGQFLVAVLANGIANVNADNPSNLWKGGLASDPLGHVCLLGAVCFDTPGDYYMSLGSERISVRGNTSYPINFIGGHVIVVPEPAALALLGLAAAAPRRR